MKEKPHYIFRLKKAETLLRKWGRQQGQISDTNEGPVAKVRRTERQESTKNKLPRQEYPKNKTNQSWASKETLITPRWHIPEEAIKKTDFYLLQFPDSHGLHFADILIITDERTSAAELKSIDYALEQLLKSNIRAYRQCVGPIQGYIVPFSFLFLAPLRQKHQVNWTALGHTIFVDWIEFAEKEVFKKLLWSEICFFLNKRATSCTSPNMLKLR
ncbi:hypothetical protein [Candidatus Similichlamydia laticola]|uniref:Uncharacterized protein n=1 Tax=Candidatus Similichlamydia laticola TaxID=2170265 RepID=A0A369KDD4_9BACT|nr:hypothetical protein [Candidatus Similichlamydia laticola]RDB31470.1 hypothetical protein HAT2_00425 [Candidatus Similichlamydia laticola]